MEWHPDPWLEGDIGGWAVGRELSGRLHANNAPGRAQICRMDDGSCGVSGIGVARFMWHGCHWMASIVARSGRNSSFSCWVGASEMVGSVPFIYGRGEEMECCARLLCVRGAPGCCWYRVGRRAHAEDAEGIRVGVAVQSATSGWSLETGVFQSQVYFRNVGSSFQRQRCIAAVAAANFKRDWLAGSALLVRSRCRTGQQGSRAAISL